MKTHLKILSLMAQFGGKKEKENQMNNSEIYIQKSTFLKPEHKKL